MDFFERQNQTRRSSRWLVLLFVLAVAAIVTATTFLVLVIFGQPPNPQMGLLTAANLQQQTGLLVTSAVGVALVMFLASLYRSASLRGGGGKVAREFGGQLLDSDTRDPKLRRLRNVVEEIALAAGIAVPEIYVLEQEDGINAFAAGYTPADAAIGVTRGTLDKLNREELQGVIAHEFSHILNGDMRLNIRLMGLIFGILVLAIVGQRILSGAYLFGGGRSRNNNGAAAILAAGIGLLAIGYIGLFFGRWIKAAVARQRESLADASAVQFTRHPGGIAGALKKIAVYSEGAQLQANTEEVNHMLFGEATTARMFATHPPLVERIRAIEPSFQPEELETLAARIQRGEERENERAERKSSAKAEPWSAQGILDSIGQIDQQTLLLAGALAGQLPEPLMDAAHGVASAPLLLLYLLLDPNEDVRGHQLEAIRAHDNASTEQQVLDMIRQHGLPAPEHRLPLLEASLPALKRRPPQALRDLLEIVRVLSEADHRISPFEFLLAQVLRDYLQQTLESARGDTSGRKTLENRRNETGTTLAALAHFGNQQDTSAAQAAYAAGAKALNLDTPAAWPTAQGWTSALRGALDQLKALAPDEKRRLIQAWITTVFHDNKALAEELELLRAMSLTIHVPIPPLSPQG